MINFDHAILRCPVTGGSLTPMDVAEARGFINRHNPGFLDADNITGGFTNGGENYFYPAIDDILLLLPAYALYTGTGTDIRGKMAYDKARVFDYYNQISYNTKNGLKIYEDSAKWVDFRDVTGDYIRNSFTRAGKHLNPKGKYLLDIASGPIGLKEYIDLSENFDIRICADISVNALIQARYNYNKRPGIFICADITHIPLQDNVCDSVLCQHTLYHIPGREQEKAVKEMYRVTRPGSPVVIVYSLFYHSWFMNISLFPVQLYRIVRHLAGKLFVRLFRGKPRLYFYPHSLRWFRKNFIFCRNLTVYCWRSTNIYFLNTYIHKWLGGKKILRWLMKSEDKYSKFWGKFGEYPVIVIRK